jgi:dihydroorotase
MSTSSFSGRAFIDGEIRNATISVSNGVIESVAPIKVGSPATLKSNQILLPAAIDLQAAARDWAETRRDTIETATKAALSGGITVLCDAPNTIPRDFVDEHGQPSITLTRINSPELVERRAKTFADSSFVDYGIQSHPPKNDPSIAVKLHDAGAFGLIYFQWDMLPWNTPHDMDDTKERMGRYAAAGLQAGIILEELAFRETPLEEQGEDWAVDHFLRRLHPDFRVRAFITLPRNVKKLAAAKKEFPNLKIETAPHYLCMDRDLAHQRIGRAAVHSAPLRSRSDVEELQALARDGMIDVFISHHTPHFTTDKYNDDPEPGQLKPKRGFTSLDIAYPVLLHKIGIVQTCKGFCETPAELLNIKKGKIAPGYEADFALIEEGNWLIDPDLFQSKGKVTPFVGEKVKYRVRKTYIRGTEVFDAETRSFTRVPVKHIR